MIVGLAVAIVVLSAGSTLCLGAALTLRRYRRASWTPMLTVLQVGLVGQAVADLTAWARGHRPTEPVPHAAYLAVSLVLLPIAAVQTRRDDGVWSGVLLAVALVVLVVLVLRMAATWG